jgi:hypothetical protein
MLINVGRQAWIDPSCQQVNILAFGNSWRVVAWSLAEHVGGWLLGHKPWPGGISVGLATTQNYALRLQASLK